VPAPILIETRLNPGPLPTTLVDPIVAVIQMGITGAAIGVVLGMGSTVSALVAAGAPPPPAAPEHTGKCSAGM
jgi:hypothetical protein